MRALVVGLGRMGTFHARVLRDLGLDVTTVDPDPATGADWPRVPRGRFDAVCIAVPIEHLAETASQFAGKTDRLMVEKPGATTVDDAHELTGLLKDQRVAVGYVERFNPQVRALKRELRESHPSSALFRRWNDRPSADVDLDLKSHDVDLARWLGFSCPVTFDTAADSPVRCREITAQVGPRTYSVDLMAHDTSPLHAQWHDFLCDNGSCATLADATATLQALRVPVAA